MFAFLKAVVLGAFLGLIVSLFIGSSGSTGGLLDVRLVAVQNVEFYWSWALFLIGTGLSLGLIVMMAD